MKEEDWLPIHKKFTEIVRKVNNYLKTNYGLENPYWELAFTKKPNFSKEENVDFNVAIFLEEGKAMILRDITINISPLLFIAYNSSCGYHECSDLPACINFLRNLKMPSYISFSAKKSLSPKRYLFNIKQVSCTDDIGKRISNFETMEKLKAIRLPKEVSFTNYEISGVKFYAPYTINDIDCILFAQENNEYDTNAIQIRRWFPIEKKDTKLGTPFFYTYEYGYISRSNNQELHSFMMDNSRILFGKIRDNKVHILGGIEVFKNELANYFVPPFILEFIK